MMAPEGDEVVPMVQPLLGEPAPVNGRMRLPETTGFGAELNPDVPLVRPIASWLFSCLALPPQDRRRG